MRDVSAGPTVEEEAKEGSKLSDISFGGTEKGKSKMKKKLIKKMSSYFSTNNKNYIYLLELQKHYFLHELGGEN